MKEVECKKCRKCGTRPATHRSTKLCIGCYGERREVQNARASKQWLARRKAGKVAFKPFYREKPTPAALASPGKARAACGKLAKRDEKRAARRLAALEKALALQGERAA